MTGGGEGPPLEYLEIVLCRDVYGGISPRELDAIDYERAMLHFRLYSREQQIIHRKKAK